jgi:Ca2+-binding RTX toxin-like protein
MAKTPTQGDDIIRGTIEADRLRLLAGNDTFLDRGFFVSDDFIFGGAGDDWLQSKSGNDKLVGGAGDDAFQVTLECDPHKGGFDRIIVGGAGLDELTIVDPQFIVDVDIVGNHYEITDKFGGVTSVYGVEHFSFDV